MKKMCTGLALTGMFLLTGCYSSYDYTYTPSSSGGSSTSSTPSTPYVSLVDSFIDLLEDHYGGTFTLVKDQYDSHSEGFVVVRHNGSYYAYDIMDYDKGDSWSEYVSNYDYKPVNIHDYYYSGGETVYVGDAYDRYGYYEGEFTFEEMDMTSKDLEKLGALKESYTISQIGEGLSTHYGLSEERGTQVAKLAVEWKKLSKSRGMTDADVSAFTKELVGISLDDASKVLNSYMSGQEESLDDFIKQAAKINNITPENMNELLKDLVIGR